ncbi:MCE family protein [[Mycobacterium] burgundiense]
MDPEIKRRLVGAASVLAAVAVVAVAVGLFRGSFTTSVPVTVLSQRAGLVMNADAKVKLHGAQVGTVRSIESLPDGRAALHLAMNPAYLDIIPSNVRVEIASTTVFGSKFVDLIPPVNPAAEPLQAGQVLGADHVSVEVNTVFEQLSSVLNKIEPTKLNETLGALATAVDGRGEQIGQMLSDFEEFLVKIDPSLPAMEHEITVAPEVFRAYADAAPDLITTVAASSRISQTLVEEQQHLDALLISVIGLSDTGNDVVGTNRRAISEVMRLLVPTTDLTNQYNPALTCGIGGAAELAKAPGTPMPGGVLLQAVVPGQERYRYPQNLPKVAATGGPQCTDLPTVGFQKRPPFVIADVGANPAQYGNEGILLNSDGLKQMLYGPIGGPPRNSSQVGHPG